MSDKSGSDQITCAWCGASGAPKSFFQTTLLTLVPATPDRRKHYARQKCWVCIGTSCDTKLHMRHDIGSRRDIGLLAALCLSAALLAGAKAPGAIARTLKEWWH